MCFCLLIVILFLLFTYNELTVCFPFGLHCGRLTSWCTVECNYIRPRSDRVAFLWLFEIKVKHLADFALKTSYVPQVFAGYGRGTEVAAHFFPWKEINFPVVTQIFVKDKLVVAAVGYPEWYDFMNNSYRDSNRKQLPWRQIGAVLEILHLSYKNAHKRFNNRWQWIEFCWTYISNITVRH